MSNSLSQQCRLQRRRLCELSKFDRRYRHLLQEQSYLKNNQRSGLGHLTNVGQQKNRFLPHCQSRPIRQAMRGLLNINIICWETPPYWQIVLLPLSWRGKCMLLPSHCARVFHQKDQRNTTLFLRFPPRNWLRSVFLDCTAFPSAS